MSATKRQKLAPAAATPAELPNVHDADTTAVAPSSLQAIKRSEYAPSAYSVPAFDLTFQLPATAEAADAAKTVVSSTLSVRLDAPSVVDLVLNAELLELESISLNGKALEAAEVMLAVRDRRG